MRVKTRISTAVGAVGPECNGRCGRNVLARQAAVLMRVKTRISTAVGAVDPECNGEGLVEG